VARLIASSQSPVFVYGKGITRGDSPQALKALIELARLAGALDTGRSALVSVKGQANSLAAYMVGLDRPFEVNGQQALYLALGDDRPSQRLIKRLEGAPFIAVQASYVSPVTAMADVVLPVEMWVEQEGHYLSLEGRLQEAHRGVTPPREVRSHVAVLQSLAESLGVSLDPDWKSELSRRVPINTTRSS
jgi:formate dehydrogenase major subunit